MTTLEQLQQDIQALSEAERQLLSEFIHLLKKSHQLPSRDLVFSPSKASFLEEASEFIGCLESGYGDLATNKKYMEGFAK